MVYSFFNKLPSAWLQLKHQRIRLLVALAGVIFAVVIVFVQLGIRDALFDSAVRLHQSLAGDIFLISPRSTSLIAMKTFPQRRLSQAMALEQVEDVAPIYLDFGQWKNPETRNYWRNIYIIGFDIRHPILDLPGLQENLEFLKLPDKVLFDRDSRSEFGPIISMFEQQGEVATEIGAGSGNRKVEVAGLFQLGTSFGSDGNLITSHLNFLRILDNRTEGRIDIGVIKLKAGANVKESLSQLQRMLPGDVKILSKEELVEFEKNYWQSSTAIGFIFNLGVTLGIIVGIVVVYQILYSNVSEHMSQYATLKAMGYRHQYLLVMVLQQALIIGVLGYIPGFIISVIQFEFIKQATLLPVAMSFERAIFVLIATLIMCFISGATAVGKLKAADPAEIF